MATRARLDAALVRRQLARSREHAAALIAAGRVTVDGQVATKSATAVAAQTAVVVRPDADDPHWASRGGVKLAHALAVFGAAGHPDPLRVEGRRCLDAGASTGGFTDVLLRGGAAQVLAVDVGYGQLAWRLRTDPRVVVHERVNVRSLTVALLGGPVSVTVADLSFIGLAVVLPALAAVTAPDGHLVLLVKPQFEVGRDALGPGGVVRDPAQRAAAVLAVTEAAEAVGRPTSGVTASPLPGPAGNVEYLLWLGPRSAPAPDRATVRGWVQTAVSEGPS